jgi:hypothetical protein
MAWTYHPDSAGIGAYLRSDPDLRAELHRRADLGLTVARALAPRHTGALAATGHVEDSGLDDAHHDRMQISVIFTIDYAAAATYRFRHNPDETARAYLMAAIPVIEKG